MTDWKLYSKDRLHYTGTKCCEFSSYYLETQYLPNHINYVNGLNMPQFIKCNQADLKKKSQLFTINIEVNLFRYISGYVNLSMTEKRELFVTISFINKHIDHNSICTNSDKCTVKVISQYRHAISIKVPCCHDLKIWRNNKQ